MSIQVVDPAEETFPYSGRIEFLEPEGSGSVIAGRAETWRDDYVRKLAEHRTAMREESNRLGASFIIHRTDRPASEIVLALHTRMGQGSSLGDATAGARAEMLKRRLAHDRRIAAWFRFAAGVCLACSACRCCGGCCG